MKKQLTYPVTHDMDGNKIEEFLRSRGYSKHLIIQLNLSPDGITIGGEKVYVTHVLKEGEILTIRLNETDTSENIVPTQMPLDIVYEDEDLFVINKPAGLPIHPSQGHYDHTLANGMAWYCAQHGEPFVYRAINRLDRDTTGLLILARHSLSAAILSEMVKNRQIHREYLAVATGKVPESGVIDAPISRVDGSTIERCVDFDRGEAARTHYRSIFYDPVTNCSLVSLKLETGRTHQIRVHLKYLGHPLPGDFLYCPDFSLIRRQALHSHRLTFLHPLSGEEMCFLAPLPADMKAMLPSMIP